MGENLVLAKPTLDLETSYLAMLDECRKLGEGESGYRIRFDLDFAARVKCLTDMEHGIGLEDWMVPQTTFWLVRDGTEVIGEVKLRHRLTPALEQIGGHIGYMIRPSERRKGYGTRILAMVLDETRKLGLTRVLITCRADNVASARIIEKNGGIRDADSVDPETGAPGSRYWIEL